jgi:hypothetical protein
MKLKEDGAGVGGSGSVPFFLQENTTMHTHKNRKEKDFI